MLHVMLAALIAAGSAQAAESSREEGFGYTDFNQIAALGSSVPSEEGAPAVGGQRHPGQSGQEAREQLSEGPHGFFAQDDGSAWTFRRPSVKDQTPPPEPVADRAATLKGSWGETAVKLSIDHREGRIRGSVGPYSADLAAKKDRLDGHAAGNKVVLAKDNPDAFIPWALKGVAGAREVALREQNSVVAGWKGYEGILRLDIWFKDNASPMIKASYGREEINLDVRYSSGPLDAYSEGVITGESRGNAVSLNVRRLGGSVIIKGLIGTERVDLTSNAMPDILRDGAFDATVRGKVGRDRVELQFTADPRQIPLENLALLLAFDRKVFDWAVWSRVADMALGPVPEIDQAGHDAAKLALQLLFSRR